VVKTLFPFLGSLAAYHGIRSSGDAFLYLLRQCLFYGKRLLLTLTHLPKEIFSNRQPSLAKERAGAKDRITRQLLMITRQRQP